jgi:hypothetical protein
MSSSVNMTSYLKIISVTFNGYLARQINLHILSIRAGVLHCKQIISIDSTKPTFDNVGNFTYFSGSL